MREDFLFYIWQYLKFDVKALKSTDGDNITIQKVGFLNSNGGPDFNDAQVTIGNTIWNGRVEIHVNASDWYVHKHNNDYKYDNVILHVVYNADKKVLRSNGTEVPTLELKGRIPKAHFDQYQQLLSTKKWLPCSGQISKIDFTNFSFWQERLFVERIEDKAAKIKEIWLRNNKDWEETLYVCIARGFGLKINADPFEQLARSLPLKVIKKSSYDPLIIEALVMGQSGMLNTEVKDANVQRLAKEYDFQRRKNKLRPLKGDQWQWFRLRPASFPSLRLAQWCQFIINTEGVFSKVLEEDNFKKLVKMFNVSTSPYWDTHYVLGKSSKRSTKKFSDNAINTLLINVLAPVLFLYGKEKDDSKYIDKSYDLLAFVKPEKNKIVKSWKIEGVEAKSAMQSQSLLQLYNKYCASKKCLSCRVGHQILKQA